MLKQVRKYSGLRRTPLYDVHIKYGGNMVPYAGFEMPVLYKGQSHIESHNWTRSKCGLFDVSHMLQHKLQGTGATQFLQKITPTDFNSLDLFSSSLSVLLNSHGGVVDDTIVTKHGIDDFYFVTNAGCRDKDLLFIKEELERFPGASENIVHHTFEGSLLALQGPLAQKVLSKFTDLNLSKLYFGHSQFATLPGFGPDKVHIARSGYTGEDGFEISIPNDSSALQFTYALLELEDIVKPIGLAARDSLRLEAGMCLYGHELNETTTPVESSLNWLISKSRRNDSFNGSEKILSQLADPKQVSFKRVGLVSKGPSPREGFKIFNESKEQIGVICSGSPSPTLGGNVAQLFINKPFHKNGTKVFIEIRNKLKEAQVTKLPFVTPNFYRNV